MNVTRIPRPLGLTNVVMAYRIDPTEENKQRVNEHVINSYVNNSFTYNYRKMSVDELSKITGIAVPTILMNITRATKTLAKLGDPSNIQQTIEALFGMVIQNGMSDRGEAMEQLQKLKASQGDGYTAFISKEVNGAIKLAMDSNMNIMNIIKTISPDKSTLIQINNQPSDGPTEEERARMITTDGAVAMISEGQIGLKDNQVLLDNIHQAEEIEDMPIVDARKQKGDHGNKEGLNLRKLTEAREDINHENRRVEEYGIDEDEDEV